MSNRGYSVTIVRSDKAPVKWCIYCITYNNVTKEFYPCFVAFIALRLQQFSHARLGWDFLRAAIHFLLRWVQFSSYKKRDLIFWRLYFVIGIIKWCYSKVLEHFQDWKNCIGNCSSSLISFVFIFKPLGMVDSCHGPEQTSCS